MLIELADALRCPAPHAESQLIAAVDERRGPRMWTGTLGCPICRASYPVVRGVAWFGVAPQEPPDEAAAVRSPDDDEADRAAALLDLREPGGLVLLAGEWASLAAPLYERCHAHYVQLGGQPADDAAEISVLRVAGALPFGPGVFRAVAAVHESSIDAVSAARVAAPRARVVLPAGTDLPAELRQLAGDARHVVAERELPASAPVPLRRRAPFVR